ESGASVGALEELTRLHPHLLLEPHHIVGILLVPDRQGGSPAVADGVGVGIVAPQFPSDRGRPYRSPDHRSVFFASYRTSYSCPPATRPHHPSTRGRLV